MTASLAATTTRTGACSTCRQPLEQTLRNPRYACRDHAAGDAHTKACYRPRRCVRCNKIRERARAVAPTGLPVKIFGDLVHDPFSVAGESEQLRKAVNGLVDRTLGTPWLLIVGPVGCGKSTEAGRAIFLRGCSADRFVTVQDLVLAARSVYGGSSRLTELQVLQPFIDAPFLVLDDLGAERPTAYTTSILNEIINRRYGAGAPTIITTNLPTRGAMVAHLTFADDQIPAQRIIDRIGELATPIRLTIGSYRGMRKPGNRPTWSDFDVVAPSLDPSRSTFQPAPEKFDDEDDDA